MPSGVVDSQPVTYQPKSQGVQRVLRPGKLGTCLGKQAHHMQARAMKRHSLLFVLGTTPSTAQSTQEVTA